MEATIESDLAGFHPKLMSPDPKNPNAKPDIGMCNSAFFIAAEKI